MRGALDDLGERFLVLYGDTYLRIDYGAVAAAQRRLAGADDRAPQRRPLGRAATPTSATGRSSATRSGAPGHGWIDYGLSVLTPGGAAASEADLAQVFTRLAAAGQLAGYEATERFYEIGTPEALAETDAFLSGRGASAAPGSSRR